MTKPKTKATKITMEFEALPHDQPFEFLDAFLDGSGEGPWLKVGPNKYKHAGRPNAKWHILANHHTKVVLYTMVFKTKYGTAWDIKKPKKGKV